MYRSLTSGDGVDPDNLPLLNVAILLLYEAFVLYGIVLISRSCHHLYVM